MSWVGMFLGLAERAWRLSVAELDAAEGSVEDSGPDDVGPQLDRARAAEVRFRGEMLAEVLQYTVGWYLEGMEGPRAVFVLHHEASAGKFEDFGVLRQPGSSESLPKGLALECRPGRWYPKLALSVPATEEALTYVRELLPALDVSGVRLPTGSRTPARVYA